MKETAGKKIMVVDDSELNQMMMESFLEPMGHNVILAGDGREALEKIAAEDPDLILLDVMMPEMDGFEVCRRLKQNERTRHTPVIMITALDKVEDNVRGIESGADDFLTRPFDAVILAARMKALLQSKALFDEIKKLEQLKEDLTRMIVHDLRTPLSSIKMSMEMLNASVTPGDGKSRDLIGMAAADVEEALMLINNLLDIGKLEANKMVLQKEDTSLHDLIQDAVNKVKPLLMHSELHIDIRPRSDGIYGEVDRVLTGRVLTNLLSNAIKFADAKSTILVELDQKEDGSLLIGIANQGVSIPPDSQEVIFEKFGQAAVTQSKAKAGTGLGLTFCKLVVEAHLGRIWVESPPKQFPNGAAFYIHLPLR